MIVGAIEELLQICEMLLRVTSLYHVIALMSMHGSLFVLHATFLFFYRFEARAGHHNHPICKFFLCRCYWC
jgi:hypothetical protein